MDRAATHRPTNAETAAAPAPTPALASLALLLVLAGCGAKSGLEAPELVEIEDAAVDAPIRPPVCIEVPDDGRAVAELTLPATLAVVDVFFLIDATASMDDEIENVREGLRARVVPGARRSIPDVQFGVAFFGEFPVEPHGPEGILPYVLRSPMTDDVVTIEGALENAPRWPNEDFPEAQVEGLYQGATGAGLPPWIPASLGCPRGGSGGACFREQALPVFVLITDAGFHNGPPGVEPIAPYRFTPAPHEYADALDALRDLRAVVLGLTSSDLGEAAGLQHLRILARDTGAIDRRGEPLVRDIGATGQNLDEGIVAALEQLAETVPLDVDAIVTDVPGDEHDARALVRAVRPVRADPADGVASIEIDRFIGVAPGTRVTFEVDIDASAARGPARIPARVVFRAFGRSRLGSQDIELVIAGDCND